MTTLRIGIASYDEIKARTMAIARGWHKPKRGEPKVWFTSMESFTRLLSDRRSTFGRQTIGRHASDGRRAQGLVSRRCRKRLQD
jgi:predicted transcriptional regulator